MFCPFFIDVLNLTGLTAEGEYLPYTLKGANISKFQSRLASPLTLSLSPLSVSSSLSHSLLSPSPASQEFSVLQPHSISCFILLLLATHPSTPRSTPSSI